MIYNAGWANLKPQQLKYSTQLGNDAAQLLESGESLSAVARKLNVSRPSLRNWRSRNPKLNAAFATFEAGKLKQEAERARVRHFKKVASGMVEAAREGASDPIQMAIKADQKASEHEIKRSDQISVPVLWPNVSVSIPMLLSIVTKRLLSGLLFFLP